MIMNTFAKMRIALFFFLSVFICTSFSAKSDPGDPRVDKIIQQTKTFMEEYEQQKVYLHTDKVCYQTGENIWIKAYLLNSITLQSDIISKEIFVELLDQEQRVAHTLILQNKNGLSEGDIYLKDSLIEGNYQLRAYTNWMRNFDHDYFFSKTIQIKNPGYENVVTKSGLKDITDFNKTVKKNETDIKVTFFPEGGNIVAGLSNKIAFKAENALGMPIDIKGTLIDNKGTKPVSFESVHDGMGTFRFLPQPDVSYKVQVTFSNGKVQEYLLPEILKEGIVMTVDPLGKDDIKVILKHNAQSATNAKLTDIVIVAQSRGKVFYIAKGEIKDKPVMSAIPKKTLPAGITQITIFDGDGMPVCERLVFIKPEKNLANIDFTTTDLNDSIVCNIKLTSAVGNFSSANVSFSATEKVPNIVQSGNENILTNLLLTSDIKGRVHNPAYYFDENNPEAAAHLDLVMQTNGWRRFVWNELLAGKFSDLSYSRVGGISVSGSVIGENNQVFPNSKVVLSVPDKFNFNFETTTDYEGRFTFPAFEYDDTVYVKIETIKETYGKPGYIILDPAPAPNKSTYPYPILYNENYDENKVKENTKRENIENKKQPKIKTSSDGETGTRYGSPSYSLKIGEEAGRYADITQYIQGKIPGVGVMGGKIVIRGVGTINSGSDPLFLLDEVFVDEGTIRTMPPSEFESVDIFKGPDASVFGSQGANGALVFHTKKAKFPKRSSIELYLAGYHTPREFYTPPYESWVNKPADLGIPRTIFWEPNVSISSNGEAEVRFKKKFSSGEYDITIEGLTESGEIIYERRINK